MERFSTECGSDRYPDLPLPSPIVAHAGHVEELVKFG
jgi:hypothetical protein